MENQAFLYEHHGFEFVLKQALSAVVDWEYVELFWTLEAMVKFAVRWGMREMDVEVVAAGVGNFDGYVRFDRRGRRGLEKSAYLDEV